MLNTYSSSEGVMIDGVMVIGKKMKQIVRQGFKKENRNKNAGKKSLQHRRFENVIAKVSKTNSDIALF